MKYHPPSGSTEPNAPYVGKNVAAQRQGSRIPPQMPEFTQREIVAAIEASGQTPTDDSLEQLARAISNGKLVFCKDTSILPGTVTIASAVRHNDYADGLSFRVRLANDVPANGLFFNLNMLGARPGFYNGGGAIQKRDYLKDDVLDITFSEKLNGFVVSTPLNGFIIDTQVTKTVHGPNADFADLNEANLWKSRRRVGLAGRLDFVCAAGIGPAKTTYNTQIVWTAHPDGARIRILGQALNGDPLNPSAMRYSGKDATARASDTAFNLNELRKVYTTEIYFAGGARIILAGDLGGFSNILFTADGAVAGQDSVLLQHGTHVLTNIVIANATNRGFATFQSYTFIYGTCMLVGCGIGADVPNGRVAVQPNSTFSAHSCAADGLTGAISCVDPNTSIMYARGCGVNGMSVSGGLSMVLSRATVSRDNVDSGYTAVNSGTLNMMGASGSGSKYLGQSGQNGYIDASNGFGVGASGSADDVAWRAFIGGRINRQGATATGGQFGLASPNVGTVATDGASIY